MRVNIKVVNTSGNPLPQYMTDGAAAMDLLSAEVVEIQPNTTSIVGTGLYVAIPEGYEIQIRSRSGLAAKSDVFVLNSPGTIDSDYRGELKVILRNVSRNVLDVKVGDRIAQALLAKVPKITWELLNDVNELPTTERGTGGLGHTGV